MKKFKKIILCGVLAAVTAIGSIGARAVIASAIPEEVACNDAVCDTLGVIKTDAAKLHKVNSSFVRTGKTYNANGYTSTITLYQICSCGCIDSTNAVDQFQYGRHTYYTVYTKHHNNMEYYSYTVFVRPN